MIYGIEKHSTLEYRVTGRKNKEDEDAKIIARCSLVSDAAVIKASFERADKAFIDRLKNR